MDFSASDAGDEGAASLSTVDATVASICIELDRGGSGGGAGRADGCGMLSALKDRGCTSVSCDSGTCACCAEAVGLFHSRYTLCIAGVILGSLLGAGDGATKPMDITSSLWLACMRGTIMLFACCGCDWMGASAGGSSLSTSPEKASFVCEVPIVDERDIAGGEIFGGVPSMWPEWRFSDAGVGEVETADNDGDGGCTCTFDEDTLTVRDWRLPPAGIFTGNELVLPTPSETGSGMPSRSRSLRSDTAARTSA